MILDLPPPAAAARSSIHRDRRVPHTATAFPRLVRVCMSCQDKFGETECVPEKHGQISHGLCPWCHIETYVEQFIVPKWSQAAAHSSAS